ncbi:hypothetical protein P692DRAFT_201278236 [Suillus brevipes Sb2]|nr:hypothetical protein P692DRAFT_201278236 [Suillus brevipes Sb2]
MLHQNILMYAHIGVGTALRKVPTTGHHAVAWEIPLHCANWDTSAWRLLETLHHLFVVLFGLLQHAIGHRGKFNFRVSHKTSTQIT